MNLQKNYLTADFSHKFFFFPTPRTVSNQLKLIKAPPTCEHIGSAGFQRFNLIIIGLKGDAVSSSAHDLMKFQNLCPILMPLIKRGWGDRRGWEMIKAQYRLKNFTLIMAADYFSDRLLVCHFPFLVINHETSRMAIAS